MGKFWHTIFTAEVAATYTNAGWETTHSDVYEYWEDAVKTFLGRLQSEIKADATISAYNGDRVAVTQEFDLERDAVNAMLGNSMVVIHSPRTEIDYGRGGAGRDDQLMSATITFVVRSAQGFNSTTDQDVPLMGDGTSRPGLVEGVTDLLELFHNSGAFNLLPDGGGTPYLWWVDLGPVTMETIMIGESYEVRAASFDVTGHKWLNYW